MPDICVGDFDSVSPDSLRAARDGGAEIVTYPADKDASDLDLALDIALERRFGPVTITAAFSGRLDHTLASLGTLLRGSRAEARVVEPHVTIHAIDAEAHPTLLLHLSLGTEFSVFAADPEAALTVTGARYELHEDHLAPWSSRGLSNVSLAPDVSFTTTAGRCLVIVNASEYTWGGTEPEPEDR
jgi:thiamine pyrophosphokinase